MPVCGNYLFFELPKKIVLNPKDGYATFWAVCFFSKVDMTCIFCYFSFFKVDTPSAWACLRRFATNFGSSVRLLPSNVFFRSIDISCIIKKT